jgi:hypothetical protein
LGVILEHRYYGTSFPVPDLSVENLRFLTTEQALADTAYLAENIEFEGLEEYDLTASETPWIVYGGSYAGAFVVSLTTYILFPLLTNSNRHSFVYCILTHFGAQSRHPV